MRSLEDRFWEKVHITPGCWLCTGSCVEGYGQISTPGRKRNSRSHRISWILAYGSIPDGMSVCHTCDVRHCVNPDHLFLGTTKDNMQDAVRKGRIARGEAVKISKLRERDVSTIRRMKEAGGSPTLIAEQFGISRRQVCNITLRLVWKHL